jgi:hypothetical protein
MPSAEEYAAAPRAATLSRLTETPVELERRITTLPDAIVARRPEPKSWSAKEIVCHLRDVEELFQLRFHTILALDEPTILWSARVPTSWRGGGSATAIRSIRTAGRKSASTPAATRGRRCGRFSGVEAKCYIF